MENGHVPRFVDVAAGHNGTHLGAVFFVLHPQRPDGAVGELDPPVWEEVEDGEEVGELFDAVKCPALASCMCGFGWG